jgi:hypothetical protein
MSCGCRGCAWDQSGCHVVVAGAHGTSGCHVVVAGAHGTSGGHLCAHSRRTHVNFDAVQLNITHSTHWSTHKAIEICVLVIPTRRRRHKDSTPECEAHVCNVDHMRPVNAQHTPHASFFRVLNRWKNPAWKASGTIALQQISPRALANRQAARVGVYCLPEREQEVGW